MMLIKLEITNLPEGRGDTQVVSYQQYALLRAVTLCTLCLNG